MAETTQGVLRARVLVNCGGLYSDRVARACGVEPDVRIVPFRAVLALKREGYHFWQVSLRDVGEWATYDGFRKMARGYWRTGVGE